MKEFLDECYEYCDQDPANCYNLGYCPYEKELEEGADESQQ